MLSNVLQFLNGQEFSFGIGNGGGGGGLYLA